MNLPELANWTNNHKLLPHHINVEDINRRQVLHEEKWINPHYSWGIINKNNEWIYFDTDDERGYVWDYINFLTESEACEYAKNKFQLKLKIYEFEKHKAMVKCPSCNHVFPFCEKNILNGEKYETLCPECNTIILRKSTHGY